MAEIQVGFMVTGAKTAGDLSRALKAIAAALERDGATVIGKDYDVAHMSVNIRQR